MSTAIVSSIAHPIADGYAEWVRLQLAREGVRSVRRGAHPTQESRLALSDALALARKASTSHLLLIDLRWREGELFVDFRIYESASGEVRGGRSVTTTPQNLARATRDPLWAALGYLEMPDVTPPKGTPEDMSIEDFAAATRALERLAQGELTRAWMETADSEAQLLVELRKEIEVRGRNEAIPTWERARFLAAKDERDGGWQMIQNDARRAYRAPEGQASLLLAAGEIQYQRGELDESQAYFGKVLELEPHNPDASLGLGRVYAKKSRIDDARKAFRHSSYYAPESIEAMSAWAEVERGDSTNRAKVLLATGQRHAQRLELDAAVEQYSRAGRIEPGTRAEAHDLSAELYNHVGRHSDALREYREAENVAGATPARMLAIGRTQELGDDPGDAERTYVTLLDTLEAESADPKAELKAVLYEEDPEELTRISAEAHTHLGEIYSGRGEHAQAISHIEQAVELTPKRSNPKAALARSLVERGEDGDLERAKELYQQADELTPLNADELKELAAVQVELKDLEGAQRSLERAVEERPIDVEANESLANVLEERGEIVTANLIRERLAFYGRSDYTGLASTENLSRTRLFVENLTLANGLSELLASIQEAGEPVERVAVLRTREDLVLNGLAEHFLHPKTTDHARIERETKEWLQQNRRIVSLEDIGEGMVQELELAFDFDNEVSMDIDFITTLNASLGTDALYVGRVFRRVADSNAAPGSCTAGPYFEVELRRLTGQIPTDAQIITQRACLAGALDGAYATWNYRAAAIAIAAFLLVGYPVLRGWGRVVIHFEIPPKMRALFSVSLSKRPAKVKDRSEKARAANSFFFEKQLRARQLSSFRRFTKSLDGKVVKFGWVPVRRQYYVVVRGPLVDLASNETVGEFLQERTVRVQRGKTVEVQFDLTNKEAAINLEVKRDGQLVTQGRASLIGHLDSERYIHKGKALLYAPLGRQILQIGAGDRVAEIALELETAAPQDLTVELEHPDILLFSECAAAVDPYLDGDSAKAAELLEQAGLSEEAAMVRESRHRVKWTSPVVEGDGSAHLGEATSGPVGLLSDEEADSIEDSMGENQQFIDLGGNDAADDAGVESAESDGPGYSRGLEVGSGLLGSVYAGERDGGGEVAIRVCSDVLIGQEEARRLLVDGARAATSLRHKHIARVEDVYEDQGAVCIVTELLEGAVLRDVVARRGGLASAVIVNTALQATAALHEAHKSGIRHGCLRPSSFFLCKDRTIKLLDFGLGACLNELRRSGLETNAEAYLAPELREGQVGHEQSDFYALGATLAYLLSGEAPDLAGGPAIAAQLGDTLDTSPPPGLVELIAKLTAPNAADRPSSSVEIGKSVRNLLQSAR